MLDELELANLHHHQIVELPHAALIEIQASMEAQKGEIYLIQNYLGADCINFGNVRLRSLADTNVFVKQNMTEAIILYGSYYNLVALMDYTIESGSNLLSFLKTSHKSHRSNSVSVAEAKTGYSFGRTALPSSQLVLALLPKVKEQ